MRQCLVALLGGLILLCLAVRAEEEVKLYELDNLPPDANPDEREYLEKKLQMRKDINAQRTQLQEQLSQTVSDLSKQRQQLNVPNTDTVVIDEETKQVVEPDTMEAALGLKEGKRVRDEFEVTPDDFDIYNYDRWSLNPSDLRFDAPQYLTDNTTAGADKTWFVLPFSITNSNAKSRRIAPFCVAWTDKGVSNVAISAFGPERRVADSMGRPLNGSASLTDKELASQRVSALESNLALADMAVNPETGLAQVSPLTTFEPGQTRWGTAVWSNFSNEFTRLKIVIYGLTNAHRYENKMRKALVLTFERNDDEFNVQRSELKFREKRWEYLWMWDQDLAVPVPADPKDPQIKVETLKTPAGLDRLVWGVPFTLKNSTSGHQEIAIKSISYVCPVEVDVGGAKVPVEVKVVDDGRSTIYKAQLLKILGKENSKDRFALGAATANSDARTEIERRKISLDPDQAMSEFWGVFDETAVDWDDVRLQVESALTLQVDKKALAHKNWEEIVKNVAPQDQKLAEQDPGILYDPRRRLTDEEMTAVQDQVKKALSGALDAAKAKKTVVAYFDCVSGLASGTCRISRSYRQPGVVKEEWLKAWEEDAQ